MEFQTPLGEMRLTWSNLNNDADDHRRQGPPTHGRAHLYFDRGCLRVEWRVPSASCNLGARVEADGEDTLHLRLCLPPVALYLGLDSYPFAKWLRERLEARGEKRLYSWEREISLRVFDWAVWWKLWTPSNEWHSTTPKWRDGSWHPFGFPGRSVDRELLEERDVDVPFPAKTYRAHAKRWRVVIRHPLFPLVRKVISVVELDFNPFSDLHGLPDSRKGGIWSSSGHARSIDGAIGKFVGEELRYNEREPLTSRKALADLIEHFARWMGATQAPSDRETEFLHFGVTHFDGTRLRVSVNWQPEHERGETKIIAEMRERSAKQAESWVPPGDESKPENGAP